MGLLFPKLLYQRSCLLKLTYRGCVNPHAALQALHLRYMLLVQGRTLTTNQGTCLGMPEEGGNPYY